MSVIVIEDWMIQNERLSGVPLLAFALIHGCTQKGEGCWYGGYEKLAERVGVTTRGAIKSVNYLVESGRIERCDGVIDGRTRKVLRSRIDNYELSSCEQSSLQEVNKVHLKGEQSSCPSNRNIIEIKEEKRISKDIQEKKSSRFTKPTIDEVAKYCRDHGYDIDAEVFVDFYESKGWMIGKSPMKDWKAAVRTWVRKRREESGETQERKRSVIYHSLEEMEAARKANKK